MDVDRQLKHLPKIIDEAELRDLTFTPEMERRVWNRVRERKAKAPRKTAFPLFGTAAALLILLFSDGSRLLEELFPSFFSQSEFERGWNSDVTEAQRVVVEPLAQAFVEKAAWFPGVQKNGAVRVRLAAVDVQEKRNKTVYAWVAVRNNTGGEEAAELPTLVPMAFDVIYTGSDYLIEKAYLIDPESGTMLLLDPAVPSLFASEAGGKEPVSRSVLEALKQGEKEFRNLLLKEFRTKNAP